LSISVSTIQSLIGQFPFGLYTAHHWFSDHPADTSFVFSADGTFAGGDLPFGLVYELHNVPGTRPIVGRLSDRYSSPLASITNYGKLAGGYASTIAVEQFFFDRPRGAVLFREPTSNRLDLEVDSPATVQLWGLYVDIPLITPTQMTFTANTTSFGPFPTTLGGTAFAGLTDTGSIALDPGTVGVRVDVTTLPPQLGVEFGSPDVVFDVGWLNWARADGVIHREWVQAASTLSFPTAAALCDTVHFSLHPGVIATLTCLVANP